MSNCKFLLLLLFAVFLIDKPDVKAQDNKFKSLFIYNFTKLIEWPTEKQVPEFIITVYGNSGISTELQDIVAKMKVNNKPIVIKQISSLSQISMTHILFICRDKTTELTNSLNDLVNKNILIITEKPSACSLGSSINFVNKSGNLGFEVSPSNLEKAKLKVNSQLIALGTVVH